MSPKRVRTFYLGRELILLLLISIIMALAMNLTNSLWPLYIQSLEATVLQVSFVISITGFAGTLLQIPSGFISDLYDRRKIFLVSIFLAVFPPLLYTFTNQWEQLIPWGMLYSIAFAIYMASRIAIIADYTPVASQMKAYSIIFLSWPIGSLIGPTVGGLLENTYGWNAIFYVATFLHIICLVPTLLLPKPAKQNLEYKERSATKKEKLDLKFFRPLLAFFLLNLFIGLGMGIVNPITPLYLTDRFKVSIAEVGFFISIGFGLTVFLTQLPAGFLADKFGKRRFIAINLALMPILFILWPFINNIILLLLIQMAINGLWSMTWPASISLLMKNIPRTRRGISSSVNETGIMLGFTIGPTIGGYLWETLGKAFPYYASALFISLCMMVMPFIKERIKT